MTNAASTIIAAAARRTLSPLGVARRGRSRLWIDDHGWWLINVEFQPSAWAKGCYLNVGHQHLWVEGDSLSFEDMERPLGGTAHIPYEEDGEKFGRAMEHVATEAARAVERRRRAHADGRKALKRIVKSGNDLEAGIAAAVLGDAKTASRRLHGLIHSAFQSRAAEFVGLDANDATALAVRNVEASRAALGLEPISTSTLVSSIRGRT